MTKTLFFVLSSLFAAGAAHAGGYGGGYGAGGRAATVTVAKQAAPVAAAAHIKLQKAPKAKAPVAAAPDNREEWQKQGDMQLNLVLGNDPWGG